MENTHSGQGVSLIPCQYCGQGIPLGDVHLHEGMIFPQQQQQGSSLPPSSGSPHQGQSHPGNQPAPAQQKKPKDPWLSQVITGASRGAMSFIPFVLILNAVTRFINGAGESIERVNDMTSGYLPDIADVDTMLEPFGPVASTIGLVILFSTTLWLLFRGRFIAVAASIAALILMAALYQTAIAATDFASFFAPIINLNPFDLYGYLNFS